MGAAVALRWQGGAAEKEPLRCFCRPRPEPLCPKAHSCHACASPGAARSPPAPPVQGGAAGGSSCLSCLAWQGGGGAGGGGEGQRRTGANSGRSAGAAAVAACCEVWLHHLHPEQCRQGIVVPNAGRKEALCLLCSLDAAAAPLCSPFDVPSDAPAASPAAPSGCSALLRPSAIGRYLSRDEICATAAPALQQRVRCVGEEQAVGGRATTADRAARLHSCPPACDSAATPHCRSQQLARVSQQPAVVTQAKALLRREAADVHKLPKVSSEELLPQVGCVCVRVFAAGGWALGGGTRHAAAGRTVSLAHGLALRDPAPLSPHPCAAGVHAVAAARRAVRVRGGAGTGRGRHRAAAHGLTA